MLLAHLVRGAVLAPFKRPAADRQVPAEAVVAGGVRVAAGPLAGYRTVCGFAPGAESLPVTIRMCSGFRWRCG